MIYDNLTKNMFLLIAVAVLNDDRELATYYYRSLDENQQVLFEHFCNTLHMVTPL